MTVRKISAAVVFAVILIAAAFLIFRSLAEEIRKSEPVPGFEVFLEKKDICSLAFKGDEIWTGGIDGLFVYRDGAFSEVGDFRQVKAVLSGDLGIWAGHDEGLTLISKTGMMTIDSNSGLPDNRVNALAYDDEGVLWAGTWGGIALIKDGKVTEKLSEKDGLIDDMVNVIFKDSADNMWIGSYVAPRGGITVISDSKKERFSAADGLLHSNINAIIEITGDFVLTGGGLFTKGGGTLFRHASDGWIKTGEITVSDGIAGEKVRSLFLDSSGRLWAGSEYDGLAVFSDFRISTSGVFSHSGPVILTTDKGLPNNEVKVISEAPDGSIWVGTRSGLLRIDKGGIDNERGSD